MKITVYTITDCVFSKQEKDYLTANKLAFEEKNLETNRDFLTEMLAVSNNFAGTPVTKIEKDNGQIVVLKGFTKEEFDEALGFTPESVPSAQPPVVAQQVVAPMPTVAPPVVAPTPVVEAPAVVPMEPMPVQPAVMMPEPTPMPTPDTTMHTPEPPVAPAMPTAMSAQPMDMSAPVQGVVTPVIESAAQPPKEPTSEDLNAILNDLQAKVGALGTSDHPAQQQPMPPMQPPMQTAPVMPQAPSVAPTSGMPSIPEPDFNNKP